MHGSLPRLIRKNALAPNPLWRVQASMFSAATTPAFGSVIPKVARRVIAATVPSARELDRYFYGVFAFGKLAPSRWTDGSFPAWYGADTPTTAMHEILHHAVNRRIHDYSGIAALDGWREVRTLLKASCSTVLIDVVGMEHRHPWLIGSDYKKCQELGRYIYDKDLHGVKYQSARSSGVCAAMYRRDVLDDAEIQYDILFGYNGTELEARDTSGNLLTTRPL